MGTGQWERAENNILTNASHRGDIGIGMRGDMSRWMSAQGVHMNNSPLFTEW